MPNTSLNPLETSYHFHPALAPEMSSLRIDDLLSDEYMPNETTEKPSVGIPDDQPTDTQPDAIRDNWHSLATSGLSEETYSRIVALAKKPDGWRGAGSVRMKTASLRRFLEFWKSVSTDAVEPFVTIAPNGNVYVEWHLSWRRHLDIEFTGDGSVFFGLFHNADQIDGRSNLEGLIEMLSARDQNPFAWRKS